MNQVDNLAVARSRLDDFANRSDVISDHREAMKCRDCEDFLQLGIEAFEWLIRADYCVSLALSEGSIEHDPEMEQTLDQLFRRWLAPCKKANEWAEEIEKNGFDVENLQKFRECQKEMLAIVQAFDKETEVLPEAMKKLQDSALEEYQNGETAEFV